MSTHVVQQPQSFRSRIGPILWAALALLATAAVLLAVATAMSSGSGSTSKPEPNQAAPLSHQSQTLYVPLRGTIPPAEPANPYIRTMGPGHTHR